MTGSVPPQPPVDAPTVSPVREWRIASDVVLIQAIVEAIVLLCREAGFSARHCQLNVPVAVTEALANAIVCGNGSDRARFVQVRAIVNRERLTVEVIDEGGGFDLASVEQGPDQVDWLEREDGRGVFLMRQLMDHVDSLPPAAGAGHCVRLTLRRT